MAVEFEFLDNLANNWERLSYGSIRILEQSMDHQQSIEQRASSSLSGSEGYA